MLFYMFMYTYAESRHLELKHFLQPPSFRPQSRCRKIAFYQTTHLCDFTYLSSSLFLSTEEHGESQMDVLSLPREPYTDVLEARSM